VIKYTYNFFAIFAKLHDACASSVAASKGLASTTTKKLNMHVVFTVALAVCYILAHLLTMLIKNMTIWWLCLLYTHSHNVISVSPFRVQQLLADCVGHRTCKGRKLP